MHKYLYYIFVISYLIIILIPSYWIFRAAFSSQEHITAIPLNYNISLTLNNFYRLYDQLPLIKYISNSIIFSLVSAFFSVIFSFLAAYAFCRSNIKYKYYLMWALLITIALPEISTIIPLYSVLNFMSLLDSVTGLCLIMRSLLTPFTVWIFVPFIKQVPIEIEEASIIDGANTIDLFVKVLFPIIAPALASMLLINFINAWNNLLLPLAYCATDSCKTLSVAITEVFGGRTPYGRPWDLISALGIVIIFPLIFLIFFANKIIIKGLTAGAVK